MGFRLCLFLLYTFYLNCLTQSHGFKYYLYSKASIKVLLLQRASITVLPLKYMKVKWSESRSVVSDSLWPHGLCSPWNSPGQNTEVGSLSLLQGILPIQGLKPGLPHCRRILYQLSHKGSPRILEWGSLSLLQGIFLTQELNQHLQHCRWILYQLSYQGSWKMNIT